MSHYVEGVEGLEIVSWVGGVPVAVAEVWSNDQACEVRFLILGPFFFLVK